MFRSKSLRAEGPRAHDLLVPGAIRVELMSIVLMQQCQHLVPPLGRGTGQFDPDAAIAARSGFDVGDRVCDSCAPRRTREWVALGMVMSLHACHRSIRQQANGTAAFGVLSVLVW
jgi:hypothetical protein